MNNLRFLSPAILLQDTFNDLADTSSAHYTDFRNQVIAFADTWRNYFIPRMFRNETMTADELKDLPRHTYSTDAVPSHYMADLSGLFFYLALLAGGSLALYNRGSIEKILVA